MYDNFDGPGFDWNGNGHRDVGDSYMDYEIMNEKSGGGGHGSGGSGGSGGGCLTTVGGIAMVLIFLYILGSCN